jgi:hypothetical protein
MRWYHLLVSISDFPSLNKWPEQATRHMSRKMNAIEFPELAHTLPTMRRTRLLASGTDGVFLPANGTSDAYGSAYPPSSLLFIKLVYFWRIIEPWSTKQVATNMDKSLKKRIRTRIFNRFRFCSTSTRNQRSKPGSKSQESHRPRMVVGR